MDFEKLYQLFEQECQVQEVLLVLLAEEREALIKLDQKRLETIASEKEQCLFKADQIRSRWEDVLPEPARRSRAPQLKLSSFLESCQNLKLRTSLEKVAAKLRNIASEVKKTNDRNSSLAQQLLGLVASSISIISSGGSPAIPTYSPKGSMAQDDRLRASSRRTLAHGV